CKNIDIPVLRYKSVQLMGKVSYSFYLCHLSINYYINRAIGGIFDDKTIFVYMIFEFIAMICGILVASISYKMVEERLLTKKPFATLMAWCLFRNVESH